MTNSGGPGIMCADALAAEGLELATLGGDVERKLRRRLGAAASVANPVDMLATAGARDYAKVMELLAEDPDVGAVIAIYTPTGLDDPDEVLAGMTAGIDAVDA